MPTDQQHTAYPEAGHAVVACRTGVKVQSVSIIPGEGYKGICTLVSEFSGRHSDGVKLERAIRISLAGPLAEKKFYRWSYRRAHARGDYQKAIGLCRYLSGAEWREWLKIREEATLVLVDRYWMDIRNVAAALLERRELTGRAVTRIIKTRLRLLEEDRADRDRWERAAAEGYFDSPE